MRASSISSSSGMAASSARSSSIWRSKSSRCDCMLIHSPAAIEKAPARRPAMPASRIMLGWAAAPATPITRARLLTSPSLTPKMVARSVPVWPAVCHRSRAEMSAVERSRVGAAGSTPTPPAPPPAPRAPPHPPTRPPGGRPAGRQLPPDLGMAPLVGRDRLDLGARLALVDLLFLALERLDQIADRLRAEEAGHPDDQANAQAGPPGRRDRDALLAQLLRPDLAVAALVRGDVTEGGRAARFLLDAGQRVVQDDRVALELQVGEALLDVADGHAGIVPALAPGIGQSRGLRTRGRRLAVIPGGGATSQS